MTAGIEIIATGLLLTCYDWTGVSRKACPPLIYENDLAWHLTCLCECWDRMQHCQENSDAASKRGQMPSQEHTDQH